MSSVAQRIGGLKVYLAAYENLIYPRFLRKYGGRKLSQDDVWGVLSSSTQLPTDAGPILDLGCGTGWFSRRIVDHHGSTGPAVVGVDQAKRAIDRAKELQKQAGIPPERLHFVVEDIEKSNLAVPDLGFPGHELASEVWLCGCLHQLYRPEDMLRRIRGLLVPGGRLCIQTLEEPPDHNQRVDVAVMRKMGQKIFRPDEVSKILSLTGYDMVRMETIGFIKLVVATNGASQSERKDNE